MLNEAATCRSHNKKVIDTKDIEEAATKVKLDRKKAAATNLTKMTAYHSGTCHHFS